MQIHRIFSATKKRQKSKHSRHFLAYSIQSFFFFLPSSQGTPLAAVFDTVSTIQTLCSPTHPPTDSHGFPHAHFETISGQIYVHAVDTFCMSPDSLFIREDGRGMCVYDCVRVLSAHEKWSCRSFCLS